ncbi:MAG: hypothetical protein RLY31_88 [Bacteroidota bacterium]|jgi:hypothetical protein
MMQENKRIKVRWSVVAMVLVPTVLIRLVPHVAEVPALFNFSPVGALALFSGAYLAGRLSAVGLPLLVLWAGNLLLDNVFLSEWYDGFTWFANWEVYLAIGLIALVGRPLMHRISPARVLGGSLVSAVLFFVVTNFFVWYSDTLYSRDASGLLQCYTAALPFFRNTFQSDVMFSVLLFGGMEWARRRYPSIELKSADPS